MAAKRLKVDLGDIAMAMGDADRSMNDYFLDTETGKLHAIPIELLDDSEDGGIDVEGLPDWMRDDVPVAKAVMADDPRYERVPEVFSNEAYRVMEGFVLQLDEEGPRRALESALAGGRPFRRFKDALAGFPEIRKRWFEYEAERKREWALEWLGDLGIEPEQDEAADG